MQKERNLIADLAKGIVKYTPEDCFKIWTGILIIMVKSAELKKGDETKGLFSIFFGLIKKPQKALILNIFFASLIFTLL